jgi:multiple sugar transport system substrate-binding protein
MQRLMYACTMTGDEPMGSDTAKDLVTQLQSHRLGRRQFMIKAAAAGMSATAIVGALSTMRTIPAHAQDARKVTFWSAFTDPDKTVLTGMVDTFNAQSTDFQVEYVSTPPEQVTDSTKLMTAVRGGTGPDIYHLDRFIVAQRAAGGLLQDLSQFSDANDYMNNYIEFARKEATYNGSPYALPFDTDTRALYYNKTMLQSVGVDPAEFDKANGPLTWDRVAEVAALLDVKDSNGNYTQMGCVPWVNQGWHYTYGFSWQGVFYDGAACSVTPDDPKIVESFQWVQDYCNARGADAVSAFGTPSMQSGFPAQQHPFILDTLAMQITGDWVIAQLAQYSPDKDYGITWMPVPAALASAPAATPEAAASPAASVGGASTTWAGGWSTVIPEGAKNAEDAWTFMKWFSGKEGQTIYTKESSHLPTWTELLSDESLFDERHVFFAKDLLPTAKNRPPLPVGAKYWDELTVAWQATYLNQGAPADLLKTAKDNTNKDLEEFCPVS